MATKYNPWTAINRIYTLKGEWDTANKAGDTEKTSEIANNAKRYYQELYDNGWGSVADELSKKNYEQAKYVNDYYAMAGKQAIRPYFYNLGKQYGMSQNDVDNLLSFNNTTGEVTFGGKSLGQPYSIIGGTSYWDSDVLDQGWNDYIKRSGRSLPKGNLVDRENSKLFDRNDEAWEMNKENPFETETGKSILAKYDLAALQGRDNAVAAGSASNGGNIDSYSAANGLRQQASLITQGQAAALSAHDAKVERARALLSDMGVQIDRVFNEDETAKNNDVSRKATIADVTGYSPDEWVASNNPYLDENGKLKPEYAGDNIDFSQIMANAKAADNEEGYRNAAQARFYKIMGNYGKYGQYDDGNYVVPGRERTADFTLTNKQIDSAEKTALAGTEAQVSMNAADNQNALDQIITKGAVDRAATQQEYDLAMQANKQGSGTGYTTNNTGTYSNGVQVGDKNGKPILTLAQAQKASDEGNNSPQVEYALNYYLNKGGNSGKVSGGSDPTDKVYSGLRAVGWSGGSISSAMVQEAINQGYFTSDEYRKATTK